MSATCCTVPRMTRRAACLTMLGVAAGASLGRGTRAAVPDPGVAARFDHLSAHGNSSCSQAFLESIGTMPPTARLQGSCCSPMSLHRYGEQIEGLRAYADLPVVPPDPYDIPAGQAAALLSDYDLALTPAEQSAYDHAMANSDEKGPCCCRCWRWHVYGGLGKRLIRDHAFTGARLTALWDLSNGCGGDSHADRD